MTEDIKAALSRSQAGMRFIAQMSIYNRGDFERLEQFLADSYHALDDPADLADFFSEQYSTAGKLRVKSIVEVDDHFAKVILEAQQQDSLYEMELRVEPDYPHRVTAYRFEAIQP